MNMGLLSSGDNECYVCGKEIDSDKCLEEDGKQFCCKKCKEKYEEEEHQDQDEICQFC